MPGNSICQYRNTGVVKRPELGNLEGFNYGAGISHDLLPNRRSRWAEHLKPHQPLCHGLSRGLQRSQ